jgi:hypothetical protein
MNPVLYSLGLLFITAVALMIAAPAQEDGSAILNNATQKFPERDNKTLNISVMNNTTMDDAIMNASNSTIGNSTNNVTFMIGGNVRFRQTNNSRIHTTARNSDSQSLNRTPFMISGYVHPMRDAIYAGRHLLNAAGLSRAVEETPHGYVTYHN